MKALIIAKLQKLGLEKRLSRVFIVIWILFVSVVMLVSTSAFYMSTLKKTKDQLGENMKLLSTQYETVYDTSDTCMKTIIKDINRIYQGGDVFGLDDVGTVSLSNQIYTVLDYSRVCFPDITALIFQDTQGTVVYSGKVNAPSKEEFQKLTGQIPEKGESVTVEYPVQQYEFIRAKNMPAWVLGRRIINFSSGKTMGYIFAVIQSDVLSSYLPEVTKNGDFSEYQLLNEDGVIVASNDKDALLKEAGDETFLKKLDKETDFQYNEKGRSKLVTVKKLEYGNLTLINQVGLFSLTKRIWLLCGFILLAGGLLVFGGIYLVRHVVKWTTRPIQDLTAAAEQIKGGNLNVRYEVTTTDEVGVLGDVFNEMLERIEEQIHDIKQAQRQRRHQELALLQAQIKPHFLYNVLDLIYIFCQMGNAKGGADVTKSLADYYRTSLSSGKEIITIADEVKNITSYLYIQKKRYSAKVDFVIDVDLDIYPYEIPKLTLQPLVENSIYHGLKTKREKGIIKITGSQSKESITLIVSDNGNGMNQERINEILNASDETEINHFGLLSVHKRIQLFYGSEYGLEIQSTPGEGTRIEIKIPKEKVKEC